MLSRLHRSGAASLYLKVGGRDALEIIVEDFYSRVLDDELLAGFYAGSDMRCVKARQVEFLGAVLGGPGPYAGTPMRQVHEGRGITRHHFAVVAAHLADSLCAAGLHPDTVTDILGAIAPLVGEIAPEDIDAVV